VIRPEGNTAAGVRRELVVGPARSENLCMCGTFMRENREIPRSPVVVIGRRAVQGTLRRYA
jgi:hypothetical protein